MLSKYEDEEYENIINRNIIVSIPDFHFCPNLFNILLWQIVWTNCPKLDDPSQMIDET